MGLKEDLTAMREQLGTQAASPSPTPSPTSSSNPLRDDLDRMRKELGHGTERRPGERQVSSDSDLAQMQQADAPAEFTSRHPIGATAFGVGAGIAVAPFVGPAGAMAVAGVVSGVGEIAQSAVETLLDLPTKPKDVPELLDRVGNEIMLGTGSEGVGRGVIGAGRYTKSLFFTPREVTAEAREAMQFLQLEGAELPLLPAKATESRAIDLLHNISEHSFTGGGTIEAFVKQQDRFMGNLAETMVERIGPQVTPEQAGELLVQSANANLRESRQPATVLYNSIKELIAPKKTVKKVPVEVETGVLGPNGKAVTRTVMQDKEVLEGGLRVSIQDIKGFVKEKADVQNRLANIGSDITGGNVLQRFESLANRPYVSDLIEFRTILRGMREGLESGITTRKDPAIGMLKTLEGKVSQRIDYALNQENPMLLAAKKEADRIWREGSKTYNNKIIRQLSRLMDIERTGAPERVVKSIFAPQALTRMVTVKNAVSPEAWNKIARQGMELMLEQSTKDGVVQGEKLLQRLVGRSGLGERGLVEAVGPVEAQNWLKFANAAKLQQAQSAAGEGSMMIQLKQPGAIIELLGASTAAAGLASESSGFTAAGGIVLGLPFIAAKVMTNPRAAHALIEGMTTKQAAKASLKAGILTRLTGAIIPRDVEAQPSRRPADARSVTNKDADVSVPKMSLSILQ